MTAILLATFTIEDTTDPTMDVAASDITVECDGTSDPSGAFATWLADNGGAQALQLPVTIEDTTNPTMDVAASDSTVECDGTADPAGAFAAWLSINGGASASDVCSGVTWTNDSTGLSDLCGATGTETVTFRMNVVMQQALQPPLR